MQFSRIKWIFLTAVIFVVGAAALDTNAQRNLPGDPVQGGLLYDNWFFALDVYPPEGSNPLWESQEMNDRQGEITWRCSECHGWDYKGADGVYASGSHRTDFPGVLKAVDYSLDEIMGWLDGTNNPDHNYSQYLDANGARNLTAFLKTKLINLNRFIDSETGEIYGSGREGYLLYRTKCVACHGYDGTYITLKVDGKENYLSDLAFEDPWRMVHKIRFGQPGSDMPAMEDENWSLQNIADVLAYIRTLPQLRSEHDLEGVEAAVLNYDLQANMTELILGAAAIILLVLVGALITFKKASKR